MKICLFGGSFDPVHNGHIYFAEKVQEAYGFDKIIWVPTYIAPHKQENKVTPVRHRLEMLNSVITDRKHWEIDTFDIDKKGISYSIDLVKHIQAKNKANTELYFLIGMDNLNIMSSWKEYEILLQLVKFIVIAREGIDMTGINQAILEKVDLLTLGTYTLSSSDIRKKIKEGKSINELVPEIVEKYIIDQGLYLNHE